MILSQKALTKIKDPEVRIALSQELNVIDQVINNYIKKNKPNGPLTTYAALKIIRAKTGLLDDEILLDERIPIGKRAAIASTS